MKSASQLRNREDSLCDALDEAEGENPIIKGKLAAVSWLLGDGDPITDEEVDVPTSDEELDRAIVILKAERENVPEYSFFGDPNWAVTDAQIGILEWAKGSQGE